jgi:hypothetical protein
MLVEDELGEKEDNTPRSGTCVALNNFSIGPSTQVYRLHPLLAF